MAFTSPGYKLHSRKKSAQAPGPRRIPPSAPNRCSSGSTLGLRSSEGSRPPAARLLTGSLNQNPICLYFLFSAGSPSGGSFDDQVAWLCVCVSLCARSVRRRHLECAPARPSSPADAGVTGGRRWGQPGPPPPPSALRSARLRSVKPRIYTASAMRLRRRESWREGAAERRGAPHTPTNCGLSVSLSLLAAETRSLLPRSSATESQAEVKIPTRALSASLSMNPILVRVFALSSSSFFFFFKVPGEVKRLAR